MKRKICIIIFYIVVIMPFIVSADLTKEQQEAVASFAENLINAQNKAPHLDSKGFALISYSQEYRIDGFQGNLRTIGYDFMHINYVGALKWPFDCSSWVGYVYYHVLGINTRIHNGLRPYVVKHFIGSEYFYTVLHGQTSQGLDLNQLQKGDIIAWSNGAGEDNGHITIYVGDGKIAHVSTGSIVKGGKSLGAQVGKFKTIFPWQTGIYVIRAKNTNAKPNTILTWPDTKVTEDLGPDEMPTVNVTYNNKLTNELTLKIKVEDDKNIVGYAVSKEEKNPTTWTSVNKKSTTIDYKILENGIYYVYVKDSKNQIVNKKIEINSIDSTIPIINNIDYNYNESDETFSITIYAFDNNKLYYSIDGVNYQEINIINLLKVGDYKVYVKDEAGNVSIKEISFTEDTIPKVEIEYKNEYSKEIDIEIKITSKDEVKYSITEKEEEGKYIKYNDEIKYRVTENKTYYLWIKTDKITIKKEIEIDKIDKNPPIIKEVKIGRGITGYSITIEAEDTGCGIEGYSIDNKNYQESNIFNNINNNVRVYVKDKCNNYSYKDISISGSRIIYYIIVGIIVLIIGIFLYKKNMKKKMNIYNYTGF